MVAAALSARPQMLAAALDARDGDGGRGGAGRGAPQQHKSQRLRADRVQVGGFQDVYAHTCMHVWIYPTQPPRRIRSAVR